MQTVASAEIFGQRVTTPARERAVPVDRIHLARYTLGNVALEAEVLQLFAEQAPLTLAALRGAETPQGWRMAAHTLKGSARAVGAWSVAECAERAERLGADAGTERVEALSALSAALDDVIRYIGTIAVV